MRALFKTVDSSSPMFKEAFTATDAIELIKSVDVDSVVKLQRTFFTGSSKQWSLTRLQRFVQETPVLDATLLLLTAETGLRIGSILSTNFRLNKHPGLLLRDLEFK
jgi:hypothetical protein